MRRSAVAKGIEHVTEAQFRFFGRNLEHVFKDRFLDIRLMNTNRAATQLDAVDDNIIVLAPNLFGIRFKHADVFGDGSGKWMMARIPAILLFIETEQREIDPPKKIESVGWNGELALRFQNVRAIETNASQDFASREPLVGGEQNQIAFFDREFF